MGLFSKSWRDSNGSLIRTPELVWALINDKWTTSEMWDPIQKILDAEGYRMYSFPIKNSALTKGVMVGHRPSYGKEKK